MDRKNKVVNISLPPLTITVSTTADGKHDYLQIVSEDQFSLNIVLIAQQITIRDARDGK